MSDRPYKCPLCHSHFRNESGMKWHVAHRHEVPAALDALGKDYEAKTRSLQEENTQLKQRVDQIERELEYTEVASLKEKAAKLAANAEIEQLNKDLLKMTIALAARDVMIQEKLNIQIKDPFNNQGQD
jgi:cell division septum initiation protein DivIVA